MRCDAGGKDYANWGVFATKDGRPDEANRIRCPECEKEVTLKRATTYGPRRFIPPHNVAKPTER